MASSAEAAGLPDYTERVIQAIRKLEINDLRSRRELYNTLRNDVARELDEQTPPRDPQDLELNRRLFEFTLRCIETDIRAGVDIDAPDYKPEGLAKFRADLEARAEQIAARAALGDAKLAPLLPEDDATVAQLSAKLASLDERSSFSDRERVWPPRRVVWHALLLRSIHETAAASRIALVWRVIEPALLIGAIIIGYALLGTTYVLNMEVATFAALGVVSWGFLRVVSTRAGNLVASRTEFYNLPPVIPFDVGVVEGLWNLIIYTGVLILALTAVIWLGLGRLPESYLLTGLVWVALAINALSIGFLLGYWYQYWPYARRVTPVFFRGFSLISGLLFVTEQLPSDYRPYFLWNPLLHGLQLLRTAYFAEYKSVDASIPYFLGWTIVMIFLALTAERVMRPNLQPR